MQLNEYQKQAMTTAVYKGKNKVAALNYALMALGGEVGELQNKFKKFLRKEDETIYLEKMEEVFGDYPEFQNMIADELGDVLWYCASVAQAAGLDLESVAQQNITKLAHRKSENALKEHV